MTHPQRPARQRLRCVTALAVSLAMVLPSMGPAAAQEGPSKAARDEASARFRKGLELYNEGDFQAALAEFRRAYALAPNFAVLYAIGQVHFQMLDYPGALGAFEKYLAEGGKQIPAARRAEVERDIAKLRARVATLDISTNVPDAEILVDDVSIGKTPLAKPVMVSAGRHRVSATREGRSTARVVEIASGDTLEVKLDLQDAQPGAAAAPPTSGGGNGQPSTGEPSTAPPTQDVITAPTPEGDGPSIPWVGWAITGALAVGAGVCGGLALGASSDLEAEKGQATTRDDLDSAHDRTVGLALATDILAGAAVVAGGISLYFTVKAATASPSGKAGSTRVVVAPRGVRLVGSF